jgi:hypothetical protein
VGEKGASTGANSDAPKISTIKKQEITAKRCRINRRKTMANWLSCLFVSSLG